jgi:succinate dehydrogenase flavin-adding protein (antitoxin of CptAB toxin-antitoxin module)
MAEKQNLVEEALIQMKSLENVVSENAKGILASTMKEEISELVKESLETEDDSEFDSYTMSLENKTSLILKWMMKRKMIMNYQWTTSSMMKKIH